MGNKQCADKMLLYAENHNQVLVLSCSIVRAEMVAYAFLGSLFSGIL